METKPVPSPQQPVLVYHIDTEKQRVIAIPHDGSLGQLYALIGCKNIDYTARIGNGDGIFCSDLLPDDPQQVAFRLRSTGQIIYGNGVWTGSNDEGDTTAPETSLEQVEAEIEFLGTIPYEPSPIYIIS